MAVDTDRDVALLKVVGERLSHSPAWATPRRFGLGNVWSPLRPPKDWRARSRMVWSSTVRTPTGRAWCRSPCRSLTDLRAAPVLDLSGPRGDGGRGDTDRRPGAKLRRPHQCRQGAAGPFGDCEASRCSCRTSRLTRARDRGGGERYSGAGRLVRRALPARAEITSDKQNFQEAIAEYKKALQLYPNDGGRTAASDTFTDGLARPGGHAEDKEAISGYQPVINLKLDDAGTHDALARVYEDLRDTRRSRNTRRPSCLNPTTGIITTTSPIATSCSASSKRSLSTGGCYLSLTTLLNMSTSPKHTWTWAGPRTHSRSTRRQFGSRRKTGRRLRTTTSGGSTRKIYEEGRHCRVQGGHPAPAGQTDVFLRPRSPRCIPAGADIRRPPRSIREAIRARPDDADSHKRLGMTYLFLGRGEEAIAEYKKAIRLDPGEASRHRASGWPTPHWVSHRGGGGGV